MIDEVILDIEHLERPSEESIISAFLFCHKQVKYGKQDLIQWHQKCLYVGFAFLKQQRGQSYVPVLGVIFKVLFCKDLV